MPDLLRRGVFRFVASYAVYFASQGAFICSFDKIPAEILKSRLGAFKRVLEVWEKKHPQKFAPQYTRERLPGAVVASVALMPFYLARKGLFCSRGVVV